MYATIGTAIPDEGDWTFEPKYDGMRVIAFADRRAVRLVTRNGKDKAKQFPEVVDALRALVARVERPVALDGEVVALERGRPGRFQTLQGRMHLRDAEEIARRAVDSPATLVAFDLLRDGKDVLLRNPWTERRRRLELLFAGERSAALRLTESSRQGTRMIARARRAGWEGVIAKRTDVPYVPGARSRDWLKLKLQHRAEFVVGGYTEPRRARQYIGALLLGYFDDGGRLRYVGHTGGGFDRAGLQAMHRRLAPLERATSPFEPEPSTNEPAHWVRPSVVVEVKFAEWTADGRLRQPIFLGVRDDKRARDVQLEVESMQRAPRRARRSVA